MTTTQVFILSTLAITLGLSILGGAVICMIRKNGTTTGVAEVGKAIGALVVELVNAINRLP